MTKERVYGSYLNILTIARRPHSPHPYGHLPPRVSGALGSASLSRLSYRHAQIAPEYERLKMNLVATHPRDRVAYTRGKTAFISRVMTKLAKSRGSAERHPTIG